MKLTAYKKKRDLKESPEPAAKVKKGKAKALEFVVQEHHARRLHWDFRLEAEGVLKSWAIPKGPSMDPEVKRLAVHVEDHPFDYKDFAGIIPEGYGAGKVIIWDKGTYSVDGGTAKESEEAILAGMKKGHIHFTLAGKKLKGRFALIKLHDKEHDWLFFKTAD